MEYVCLGVCNALPEVCSHTQTQISTESATKSHVSSLPLPFLLLFSPALTLSAFLSARAPRLLSCLTLSLLLARGGALNLLHFVIVVSGRTPASVSRSLSPCSVTFPPPNARVHTASSLSPIFGLA